ncbi:PKD repeat protein [Catalinimonas alkaloidigena]|uniref:PKD domain-containing protein n=1 Tax=Catalinimonas alkaloidigena TaxID=1075417 RepID=UPI0024061517|nr:PKD domain-containing protein [Catalinimonas alkaloidigena]MDF9799003.1 PKD repeat protein [Catalinimonas alkaloidigena]
MKHFFLMMLPLFLIMVSCEEEETPKPDNKLEANAGADQQVEVNSLVTLDGSASKDGNGETFNYAWTLKTQPAASEAELKDKTVAKPTITPDAAGEYVIELKISNESGSDTDEVTIKVSAAPDNTATIIDADIAQDRVLKNVFEDPELPDYHVSAMVAVNAKLTIEPGVVIIFDEDKGLKINADGKLIAEGTETQLITFTGKEAESGYWAGITILSSSTDNEMSYTEVKYAGSEAVYPMSNPAALGVAKQGYLKLTNSTITYAADHGLLVSNSGTIDLAHNYFLNNPGLNVSIPLGQAHKMDAESRIEAASEELNYVALTGGFLEEDEEVSWVKLSNGTAYKLIEEVVVSSGLRIQEGAHLRFNPNKFFRITPDGYLYAKGSNSLPITFDIAPEGGFRWGGILIQSSSPDNLLEWVKIIDAGNGIPAYGMMHSAALSIDNIAASRVSIKNTYISGSRGYGLYVEHGANLLAFADNSFEHNEGTALALPIHEIGKLSASSVSTSANGMDAIEIIEGSLKLDQEASWTAMADGTAYYVPKEINIMSGLKVTPGVRLNFGADALMKISQGYLNAVGTADAPIVFTGAEQQNGYWQGILIQSGSSQNVLDYAEVAYGGSNDMPGMVNTRANIAVDALNPGKLIVINSSISHGAGWGIAVETGWGATINDDVESSNLFDDLSQGNLYKY